MKQADPTGLSRRRVLTGLSVAALAVLAPGCQLGQRNQTLHGVDLSPMSRGLALYLRDTKGQGRQLRDFRGRVLVLFFGFVHCPDVCPTTLARAVQIKHLLGEQARQVQFAFVTLDPERDTPEILVTYVSAFDASFIGLSGSPGEIAVAAKNLNVAYEKVPFGETYTIDHSTRSYVFDRDGVLRVGLTYDMTAAECVEDIQQVLGHG